MFRKKVQAFDQYIPNSNSWDFLPAQVKKILREAGFQKTDFNAFAVPKDVNSRLLNHSYAILRCKPTTNGFLTFHHLEEIFRAGVMPTITKGVFELQLKHEDHDLVKKD